MLYLLCRRRITWYLRERIACAWAGYCGGLENRFPQGIAGSNPAAGVFFILFFFLLIRLRLPECIGCSDCFFFLQLKLINKANNQPILFQELESFVCECDEFFPFLVCYLFYQLFGQ